MTLRSGIALFLFLTAMACCAVANLKLYSIIEEVNAGLPKAEQFSHFWTGRKYSAILDTYQRLCPESRSPLICRVSMMAVLFLMAGYAWASGMFGWM